MYKIDTDKDNKLIYIELSGQIQCDELQNYINELINLVSQFGKNEVMILATVERQDPFAQCCIPLLVECYCKIWGNIKKVAYVQKRVVTRMQVDRIVKEVNNLSGGLLAVRTFSTRKEALKFLNEG